MPISGRCERAVAKFCLFFGAKMNLYSWEFCRAGQGQLSHLNWPNKKEFIMRDNSEVFEAMWRRREQVWNEIARKRRRREQNAIFHILKDRGDDHEQDV